METSFLSWEESSSSFGTHPSSKPVQVPGAGAGSNLHEWMPSPAIVTSVENRTSNHSRLAYWSSDPRESNSHPMHSKRSSSSAQTSSIGNVNTNIWAQGEDPHQSLKSAGSSFTTTDTTSAAAAAAAAVMLPSGSFSTLADASSPCKQQGLITQLQNTFGTLCSLQETSTCSGASTTPRAGGSGAAHTSSQNSSPDSQQLQGPFTVSDYKYSLHRSSSSPNYLSTTNTTTTITDAPFRQQSASYTNGSIPGLLGANSGSTSSSLTASAPAWNQYTGFQNASLALSPQVPTTNNNSSNLTSSYHSQQDSHSQQDRRGSAPPTPAYQSLDTSTSLASSEAIRQLLKHPDAETSLPYDLTLILPNGVNLLDPEENETTDDERKHEWLLRMNKKLKDTPIGSFDPVVLPLASILHGWAKQGPAGMVELWLQRALEEISMGNEKVVVTSKMFTMAGEFVSRLVWQEVV
jgi:hypothetical protein